jgi:uncharacterized protein with von Willebrand factor type A (vWA) domain
MKKGLMSAMRQLSDGHWVLAFPDAERSSSARTLVHQHAAKLRALYCEVLEPITTVSLRAEQEQQQKQTQEEHEERRAQQQRRRQGEGSPEQEGLYQLL